MPLCSDMATSTGSTPYVFMCGVCSARFCLVLKVSSGGMERFTKINTLLTLKMYCQYRFRHLLFLKKLGSEFSAKQMLITCCCDAGAQ